MDVLCFIWDQCFIGMDTVGYQCLPYITATWLILLREKLMSCTLVRHAGVAWERAHVSSVCNAAHKLCYGITLDIDMRSMADL